MTAIFSLEQWFEITDKVGTSGDQVSDILYSWKDDREQLVASLEKWKRLAKEGENECVEKHEKILKLQNAVKSLVRKLMEIADDRHPVIQREVAKLVQEAIKLL